MGTLKLPILPISLPGMLKQRHGTHLWGKLTPVVKWLRPAECKISKRLKYGGIGQCLKPTSTGVFRALETLWTDCRLFKNQQRHFTCCIVYMISADFTVVRWANVWMLCYNAWYLIVREQGLTDLMLQMPVCHKAFPHPFCCRWDF